MVVRERGITGVHTINRGDGVTVVDWRIRHSRWRRCGPDPVTVDLVPV